MVMPFQKVQTQPSAIWKTWIAEKEHPSMGVRNLWKLLAPCGEKASIEGKTLAIDTSIWVHQYKNMPIGAVLYSISKRIFRIVYNGARPVFVFDGAAPELKKSTLEQRKRDELRALLRGIARNKKCRVCGKVLRECEHVNDLSEASFEEVNNAVSKRISEHKYNWGEFSDEDSGEERALDSSSEAPGHRHFCGESISSFRAESIRSLSKTRQLQRLIELRQKRRIPMPYDNSNSDRFSESQIENVKKRNMVNAMIRELNDSTRRRVLSDWSIQSELKKHSDAIPVQVSGPHEESSSLSASAVKTEDVEIEDLFGKAQREEWVPVYEEYPEKGCAAIADSADSLIKINTELAMEMQNEKVFCSTVPAGAGHLQTLKSVESLPKNADDSSSSVLGSIQPSNLSSSEAGNLAEGALEASDDCGADSSDHQSMHALEELQECLAAQESQLKDWPVREEEALQKLSAGKVVGSDFRRIQEIIKDVLGIFGIPFVESPGEADPQCGRMFKKGLIDGVISEDSDMIIYGTTVYKNFFRKDRDIVMFTFEAVQEKLGLGQDDLIKLSFLLGSDYCIGVKGIGIKKAVENIRNVGEDEVEPLRKVYTSARTKEVERLEFGRLDAAKFQKYLLKNGVERSKVSELMIYCQKMKELG